MITVDGKNCSMLAWIPARGGSKGLPRKALRDIGGKPVIAHSIEHALAVSGIDRVLVNTDNEEIRDVAIKYGAEVPFLRPAEFAQDDSSLDDALEYQWQWLEENEGFKPDIHIGMSPTYPFRRKGLIDDALRAACSDVNAVNIRSVLPVDQRHDNYWIQKTNGVEKFCFDNAACFQEDILYQNLFSFNIIFECREYLFYDENWRKVKPFSLSPLEALDLDEPKDLEMALILAELGATHSPQPGKTPPFEDNAARLWGKQLSFDGDAHGHQVAVHQDYPQVSPQAISEFTDATRKLGKVAVTGCLVEDDYHPYRLLKEMEYGRLEYAVDISQDIRGSRQAYPVLHRFAPAMVSLPPGMNESALTNPENFILIEMDANTLLDKKDPFDRLRIASLGQAGS